MKLKISPQYLLKLFYNICLVIGLGFISSKAISKTEPEPMPGIIESLEKLQSLQTTNVSQLKSKLISTTFSPDELDDVTDIKIEPTFLQSTLFHSDNKYLSLIQNDECKFYSLLENNLLKNGEGDINEALVIIKNKKGVLKSGIMPLQNFFEQLYKIKCLTNRDYKILFNDTNFSKTISGIKFNTPKGENDCHAIHHEWLMNSYTPYLCKISNILKLAKSIDLEKMTSTENQIKKDSELYISKINPMQRNYIENLCSNLNHPNLFCNNYLKSDLWNKVISGEIPAFKMSYKCENVLNLSETITIKDLKLCSSKFLNDSNICISKGNSNYLSFFPMPNCEQTSLALTHSKLITNYHDCPGNIDNEAITNVHRIVNHFAPRTIVSNQENCSSEANYSLAKLYLEIKYEKGWPLKICYQNRIENKENCVQYIPGSRANDPISEDQVISKILFSQKGAPAKTKCTFVNSKKYNPLRTDYKSGCFIVFNADTCTTLSCEKKIYWEDKIQKDIHYIGTPVFEYYPSAFSNDRYSVKNMLNDVKGIQSRAIKNLTDFKFYLDKIPSSIIHGVGCIEDLLPDVYTRTAINQCHPLPFIADGYIIQNGEVQIVTRSAIDDLHSPRLISWTNIYNSVAAYSELHPLNTWTLNGLKK